MLSTKYYINKRILPGEGNGNPVHYSCLGIPGTGGPVGVQSMGLQKNQTRLSVSTTATKCPLERWSIA